MIRRLRKSVLVTYLVIAVYAFALYPHSRYGAEAALSEKPSVSSSKQPHRLIVLSEVRTLADENPSPTPKKVRPIGEQKKTVEITRKKARPATAEKSSIRLRWARMGSSRPDSAQELPAVLARQPDATIRMRMTRTMTEDSVARVEKVLERRRGAQLSRTEPSRDRKIKKFRTVWRPWFGNMIRSLTWGGQVYDTYSTSLSGSEEESRNTAGYTANASASTFILEPWIAFVDGSLGLSGSMSDSETYSSDSIGLTSALRLNVFPQSFFPFSAFYGMGINEATYGKFSVSTESTMYGFNQRYSPPGGARYSFGYDRRLADSSSSGDAAGRAQNDIQNEQNNTNLSISKGFDKHSLSFKAASNKANSSTAAESEQTRLLLDHDYRPRGGLTFDNAASLYRYKNISGSRGSKGDQVASSFTRDTLQLNSYSYLTPESSPWRANFGARYLVNVNKSDSRFQGGRLSSSSTENSTANLNAGLNYDFNKNLHGNASVDASRQVAGSGAIHAATQNLGLSYTSDSMSLFTADYGWQYGTGLTNTLGDNETSFTLNTSLGHDLGKNYEVFKSSTVAFNISQSYSIDHSSGGSGSRGGSLNTEGKTHDTRDRLTHSASASFGTKSMRTRSSFRISGTDSRDRGVMFRENGTMYQAVDFFAVFDMVLSKYQMFTGSFDVRSTSNNINKERRFNKTVTSNGSIAYRNSRFWNIRGLRFSSIMDVSEDDVIPSFGEEGNRSSFEWENELIFSIGKLEASGTVRTYRANGKDRNLLILRVMRSFGM